MRQCDNGNTDWTCGLDPSNCDSPFSVPTGRVQDYRENDSIIAAGPPGESNQSSCSATVTTTLAASTSTGSAVAQTPAASMPSASSSSTSATTVGLGAGLGVGIPLLIALLTALFFLFRARKEIKSLKTHQPGETGTGTYHANVAHQQTGWNNEHKSPVPTPAPQYSTPTHSSQPMPEQQVWEAPNRPERMSRAELQS